MTVGACPHCDPSRFRQRLRVRDEFGFDNRGGDPSERYYCDDSGNSFDEPLCHAEMIRRDGSERQRG